MTRVFDLWNCEMTVQNEVKRGRRARSKNGERRKSNIWNVRDVAENTRIDVGVLASMLGATQASVIELAIANLKQQIVADHADTELYCKTTSLEHHDLSWLLDKNAAPSNHPSVIELEKRLQEKRNARDILMGRTPSQEPPEASECDEGDAHV